jgi:hypothetical protein
LITKIDCQLPHLIEVIDSGCYVGIDSPKGFKAVITKINDSYYMHGLGTHSGTSVELRDLSLDLRDFANQGCDIVVTANLNDFLDWFRISV